MSANDRCRLFLSDLHTAEQAERLRSLLLESGACVRADVDYRYHTAVVSGPALDPSRLARMVGDAGFNLISTTSGPVSRQRQPLYLRKPAAYRGRYGLTAL